MRDLYYHREGKPVPMLTGARELERPERIVKQTRHKENGVEFWLSTVFLGLDYQYGDGPPLIFETMRFVYKPEGNAVHADTEGDLLMRYATEQEALDEHKPELWS